MSKIIELPKGSTAISRQVLEQVQQFDVNQLNWLSGYCSGIAFEKQGHINLDGLSTSILSGTDGAVKNNNATGLSVVLLYGSQTGNSKSLAESISCRLSESQIPFKLSNVDNFKPNKLKEPSIIIMVVSTHGEGEPPDDAMDFYELMHGKRSPKLQGSYHAVLSLGDSSYEKFCQTGKDFDNSFSKQGSTVLLPRLDCDLDYQKVSNQWIEKIIEKVKELTNANLINNEGDIDSQNTALELTTEIASKDKPYSATVLANQRITGEGSSKTVHHIELAIDESKVSYLPGDSLGVWVKNNKQLVNEILLVTGIDFEELVDWKTERVSVGKLLAETLEITLINPSLIKSLIELLENSTDDKSSKTKKLETLNQILENDYSDYIKTHQIIDLLFLAEIKLTGQQLVNILKPIKPRIYSISSSLEAFPEEVHITVALKENTTRGLNPKEVIRKGAASQYLIENLSEDDEVMVYVQANERFKLPENNEPIIMLGAGTGVAPYRSFLQQRELQSSSTKNWLIFGNPNFNTDFLYQTEIQGYLNDGLLEKVSLAFSRDQKSKIYVQDKLLAQAESIWDWISSKNAYFYVCGDMNRMAKDVHKVLVQIVSEQSNRSKEEAEEFLKQLKKENRYQRDVY